LNIILFIIGFFFSTTVRNILTRQVSLTLIAVSPGKDIFLKNVFFLFFAGKNDCEVCPDITQKKKHQRCHELIETPKMKTQTDYLSITRGYMRALKMIC